MPNPLTETLAAAARLTYPTAKGHLTFRAARAIQRRFRTRGTPTLIFQMGKVGSTTVYESLRRTLGEDAPLFHLHALNTEHLAAVDERLHEHYPTTRSIPMHFIESLVIARHLQRHPDERWKIITLVREPVARNISAFFQNLQFCAPDFDIAACVAQDVPNAALDDLRTRFLADFPGHHRPLEWFDVELHDTFEIDVLGTPFDIAAGAQTYAGPRADALVIRLDDLDRVGAASIRSFLDLDGFDLHRGNSARDKIYYPVYRRFVDTVRLPDDYLDDIYTSRFVRHFYTPDEISAFRVRWRHQPLRAAG